ncbi:MAG: portal protein [Verrucomicrobiae bacterium]
MEPEKLAQWICDRRSKLVGERAAWDSLWQDIGNYVMPRKAEITSQQGSPGVAKHSRLFDGTAIRANQILANGQLSWMTPMESRWFSFDPPHALKGKDKVEQWYRRCTEIAQLELARSNFYTEIHELYLDRGAFGTAAMTAEEGEKSLLNFRLLSCGSYAIAEDSEGNVDTMFREFTMTLRAAAQKFGEENLHVSMRELLKDPKRLDQPANFVHAMFPRADFDPEKRDGSNMPWASVYVDTANKKVLRESGYDEQPFFATRYLLWGKAVYGWSPSWMALPEARQLNFLEKQMDALAEIAAFPRIQIPDGYKGTVNLKANGITYFDPNGSAPKEWLTGGRYDIGKDRAEIKRKAINEAFHVDLFQMFSQLEKQMTAREVSERAGEKMIQFSPTFARMTTELFNPLLQRVFAILLRAGRFPEIPRDAVLVGPQGPVLAEPTVTYSSRIALAVKSHENSAFYQTIDGILPIVQVRPELMDNFDWDEITRDLARNNGLPSRWLLEEEEVAQRRNARAQQVAQAQQMQQMQMAADSAAKVGGIPNDSAAVQMLKDKAAA